MSKEKLMLLSMMAVFAMIIAIHIIKFYTEFFRKIRYYKTEIRRSRSHNEAEYWRRKLKYHKSKFLFGIPFMRHRRHRNHRHKHT